MELGSRTALHLSFRGEEKGVACFVYQVWNWSYSYSMNSGFESYKLKIYKFWHLKQSNPKLIECIKIPLFWNSEINPNLNPRFLQYPFKIKILFTSALERGSPQCYSNTGSLTSVEPLCLFYEVKAPGLPSASSVSELPLYPPATAHAELQQFLLVRFSQKCYWILRANICSRTESSTGLQRGSPNTEVVFAMLWFG